MKRTSSHLTPEIEALFKEFEDETDMLDTFNTLQKSSSNVSPSSLLEVLNEAKALVDSLQSQNQPDNQSNEIISRLTHLEKELSELKKIISNQ